MRLAVTFVSGDQLHAGYIIHWMVAALYADGTQLGIQVVEYNARLWMSRSGFDVICQCKQSSEFTHNASISTYVRLVQQHYGVHNVTWHVHLLMCITVLEYVLS